ncbi:MAG: hypothetical protein HY882_09915 [Deltaproteobacteria bacterium]|nr:hypothetical protein [Deltaproteobacteria bacterium]
MPLCEFEGKRPRIGETSFGHLAAILIGGVTIGENCYIGPGAVLRGGTNVCHCQFSLCHGHNS